MADRRRTFGKSTFARNMPFQGNRNYLRERVTESLGLSVCDALAVPPVRDARGVRKSPLYDRLCAVGACHGEAFGWERPNWYAPEGSAPEYEYSYFPPELVRTLRP